LLYYYYMFNIIIYGVGVSQYTVSVCHSAVSVLLYTTRSLYFYTELDRLSKRWTLPIGFVDLQMAALGISIKTIYYYTIIYCISAGVRSRVRAPKKHAGQGRKYLSLAGVGINIFQLVLFYFFSLLFSQNGTTPFSAWFKIILGSPRQRYINSGVI